MNARHSKDIINPNDLTNILDKSMDKSKIDRSSIRYGVK